MKTLNQLSPRRIQPLAARILRPLLTFILIIAIFPPSTSGKVSEADSLLRELDQTIARRDSFTVDRRDKIARLQGILPTVDNPRDRYNIYRGLYGAYRGYRCDSAIWVAEQRLATAREAGSADMVVSASLNLAEGYSSAGDCHEALEILDTLPRHDLKPYQISYLYSIYGDTYSRLEAQDAIGTRKLQYDQKVKCYRDSSISLYKESDKNYHYLKIWQLMDAGHWKAALSLMGKTEARFGDKDDNPAILVQKALIYHNLGDSRNEKICLAKAAICDLQAGRKDYLALAKLANLLNREGDDERAYTYIRCALDDALFCNARPRSEEILESVPIIDAAYHEADRTRIRHLWIFLGVIAVMAAALGGALWIVKVELAKNRAIRQALKDKNEELREANIRLNEANAIKEGYIKNLFDAYSSYINRFAIFRKNLSRLLTVGKYSEALDIARSNRVESDELKELYARFDSIFLSLYPDFIDEYNSMVKEEAKINPKSGSLTSGLRVLAMIKLGFTSTASIAAMLHYTTQTVYNYRNRIRANLIVDTEEFNARFGIEAEQSQ